MKLLVGLELDGGAHRERLQSAWLGEPVWGPHALLGDLELRLGLVPESAAAGLRVQAWSARMGQRIAACRAGAAGAVEPVYAASYQTDPTGTAAELLRWRDELCLAGWNGNALEISPRLRDLSQLEGLKKPELPQGYADRVQRVAATLTRELHETAPNQRALRTALAQCYAQIDLAESAELWPRRWQQIFEQLKAAGVAIAVLEPRWQFADADCDLGRVQRALNDEALPSGSVRLQGDGSLVILRAATSIELAGAVAAWLGHSPQENTWVLRSSDDAVLDAALAAQGCATLGCQSSSAARPALHVLELAFAVSYAPRSPARVLELLTAAVGPFTGSAGRQLADALCDCPGVGNADWNAVKETLPEKTRQRVEEWLEGPLLSTSGATRSELLAIAQRVYDWQLKRMGQEEEADAAALAQTAAVMRALEGDPEEKLDRVSLGQLLSDMAGQALGLVTSQECAGRVAHVDAPAQLFASAEQGVWWGFASEERTPRFRWRAAEVEGLKTHGVQFVDPASLVERQLNNARRGVFAAKRRLMLASATQVAGTLSTPHPLLDEIVARLGTGDEGLVPVVRQVSELLQGRVLPGGVTLAVETLLPLPLPSPRSVWTTDAKWLGPRETESASSLETLLGCPLKWALNYKGRLRRGGGYELPSGPLLFGRLGHRLVEVLYERGHLNADTGGLRDAAAAVFDELLSSEAAHLLAEGASFELAQLRRQLIGAVVSLGDMLVQQGLHIVGVEREVNASWRERPLGGRIDLLLNFQDGREAVIDLKWGLSGYIKALKAGQALQLAVYVGARKQEAGSEHWPPAAYFSLSRGELATSEPESSFGAKPVTGASLAETWARAQRTSRDVEHLLGQGTLVATGLEGSAPLLQVLKVPKAEQAKHYAADVERACTYCDYGDICGKNWEAQQ